MEHKEQARLKWVQMYLDTGDAGLTCRRCGISRPTLRKWVGRYQSDGLEGLHELSRRPKTAPNQKIFAEQEKWILELRRERRLGARRIQHELRRLNGFPPIIGQYPQGAYPEQGKTSAAKATQAMEPLRAADSG